MWLLCLLINEKTVSLAVNCCIACIHRTSVHGPKMVCFVVVVVYLMFSIHSIA